jgi:hypothetical protein
MPVAFVDFLRKGDFVSAGRLRLLPSALQPCYAIVLLV